MMKLTPETLPYLANECFDDDYKFHMTSTDDPADANYLDRITVLEQFVAKKKHCPCQLCSPFRDTN